MNAGTLDGGQRYTAFGLTISSELPLPELGEAADRAETDVKVVKGTVPVREASFPEGPGVVVDSSDEFTLLYQACAVSVREGNEIVVDPAADATERDLRWVVLGPAFNFLLHQRGHLVLHASVVSIDGSAVAFVGESGSGKSTTAAAFVDEGHRLLGDDIAGIDLSTATPTVKPGFPSIKLREPAASRFERRLSSVPTHETTQHPGDERFYRVDGPSPSALPLRAVYRLEDGTPLRVTRLDPPAAAATLAQNAYTVGIQGRRDEATLALSRASKLAETIPVSTLRRPREFDSLSDVVDVVKEECR